MKFNVYICTVCILSVWYTDSYSPPIANDSFQHIFNLSVRIHSDKNLSNKAQTTPRSLPRHDLPGNTQHCTIRRVHPGEGYRLETTNISTAFSASLKVIFQGFLEDLWAWFLKHLTRHSRFASQVWIPMPHTILTPPQTVFILTRWGMSETSRVVLSTFFQLRILTAKHKDPFLLRLCRLAQTSDQKGIAYGLSFPRVTPQSIPNKMDI